VITQNLCLWKYRSSECGYTGAPVFNSRDQTISTDGQSTEAVTVINAWYLREQRKAELQAAIETYNQSLGAQEAACAPFALLEIKYSRTVAPLSFVRRNADGDEASERYSARFSGSTVTLGQEYRQGRQRETVLNKSKTYFYEIEQWGLNPAACTAAGVAVAAAAGAVTTAQNNLNSAEAALSAAIAALPANDPLRLEDVCGKRVSSCTLHFPEQSLPFGGFPGANVTRS
jgi:hypothetical protein